MDTLHKHQRQFQCDKCQKRFSQKVNLQVHIKRVHDKISDMKCEFCDFAASTACEINKHTRVMHLSGPIRKKSHACNECKYSSYTQSGLIHHKKSSHTIVAEENQHKCEDCEKKFIHKSKLVIHIKRDHLKIRKYTCNICDGKSFFTKQNLDMHIKSVHHDEEKEYKCTYCKYVQRSGRLF